jgi:formate dehydrogenase subunit gamma
MQEALWFDSLWALLLVAPFLGVLVAAVSKRTEPVIRKGKVLRHDGPARLAHWTHAFGTVFLLVSGIVLGTRYSPAFVTDSGNTAAWFNVHFAFAALFLFGTFYWLGNTIISRHRFREHLPHKNAISSTLNHYGALLKIKGAKMPEEEKYFESERLAFLAALGGAGLMVITGIIKALAHLIDMPGVFLNIVTWAHDIGALLMLLFLLAHLFFGSLLPVAWKAFPSIITGYMSVEAAKHEHPAWMKNIAEEEGAEKGEETSAGEEQK